MIYQCAHQTFEMCAGCGECRGKKRAASNEATKVKTHDKCTTTTGGLSNAKIIP